MFDIWFTALYHAVCGLWVGNRCPRQYNMRTNKKSI